jgi:hypothetical protein
LRFPPRHPAIVLVAAKAAYGAAFRGAALAPTHLIKEDRPKFSAVDPEGGGAAIGDPEGHPVATVEMIPLIGGVVWPIFAVLCSSRQHLRHAAGRQALGALLSLLEDGDVAAQEVFEQRRADLALLLPEGDLDVIEAAIGSFDFGRAAAYCRRDLIKARKSLAISGGWRCAYPPYGSVGCKSEAPSTRPASSRRRARQVMSSAWLRPAAKAMTAFSMAFTSPCGGTFRWVCSNSIRPFSPNSRSSGEKASVTPSV